MRVSSPTISPDRRARLVVMLKEPRPGRVKTRLGAEMGAVGAAWWYRHQVARLLRSVRDPRWELLLAVGPDSAMQSRVWPANLPRVGQGTGDLGARMARIFRSLPPGPACIIGSDIPGVNRHHISGAFRSLGSHDAVIGPAPDGGYWLIGMKRSSAPSRGLFEGVRWSSAWARTDTEASLGTARIAHVTSLRDVDTAEDLRAL
ncbi:hypothetical protein SAMN05421688_1544 [Poseidonocella pacifica]|uniref:Glycosyltransferase n=1 Tax=Poseidonocella pacifica TaxID=871651 RepID=A0A1I0WL18_9RHOB|nr:TIGR04282 family arsenosugar biosynthesis glycosyltransferase [Poseidonocella pacifica]SFA89442.1 hypothetical protein SAMN05421688_1544 [Poseidonocella pacifica]